MNAGRGRAVGTYSVLLGAVLFGMLLAGILETGPQLHAAPATPVAGSAAAAPSFGPSRLPSFADLAEKVLPAVVSIDAQTIATRSPSSRRRGEPQNPFDFFLGPDGRREGDGGGGRQREFRSDAGGSGFVVSADGFVVTNNHVIDGSTKVRVRLGERDYDAQIKGVDPATDLALLKIEVERPIAFLDLGDSDRLRVGDYVMAVGNPLTLSQSVTVGVVSAKGRSIGLSQDTSFENFIQTDAAINRGNSGGPLVNLAGEVIGIATAMNWGAENIGFAVPVNTLRSVLPQLKETGKVSRGYLGINIQNVTFERAQAFGLTAAEGALVTSVVDGSPADVAGIQHGDVVVSVDGRPVKETRDLIDYVSARPPGTVVQIDVLRDGKAEKKAVKLAEREAAAAADESTPSDESRGIGWLGIDVQDLTPQVRQSLGVPERQAGVVIREVAASSPLYDEGVAPGDLILEVNGKAVESADELASMIGASPSASYVRLYLKRFNPNREGDGVSFFAIVRVP